MLPRTTYRHLPTYRVYDRVVDAEADLEVTSSYFRILATDLPGVRLCSRRRRGPPRTSQPCASTARCRHLPRVKSTRRLPRGRDLATWHPRYIYPAAAT